MTREEREKHLDWLYRLKSEIFVFMPKDWMIPFADALDVAIKALKQEPVLDKIRAEIEEHVKINQNLNTDRARALCWCLDVIDKHKVESEDT